MSENPKTESALKPLLLTYEEAMVVLGIKSKKAIQILVRDGKLQVVFHSPQVRRIPYVSCEQYVADLITAGEAEPQPEPQPEQQAAA